MWRNTVAIHIILKKKNYKAKFSTSSILKKIKSTKTILKKNKKNEKKRRRQFWRKKNRKKIMWGKLKLNSQPAKY